MGAEGSSLTPAPSCGRGRRGAYFACAFGCRWLVAGLLCVFGFVLFSFDYV